jgi:hypothetical protein
MDSEIKQMCQHKITTVNRASHRSRPKTACCRQGPRIARCLRAHPSGFTTLVAKQPVHEQARVQSCALLREQWTYPARTKFANRARDSAMGGRQLNWLTQPAIKVIS